MESEGDFIENYLEKLVWYRLNGGKFCAVPGKKQGSFFRA